MIPFTALAALLLAGAGCTSVSSSGNDEAKVVARILARTVQSPLAFGDQAGAQHLVSSLDTSEYFSFGVILDAQKKVFASYCRPDQISEKEKFLTRVTHPAPSDRPEMLMVEHGMTFAMVPVETGGQTVGFVAIGRKGR